MEQLTDLKAILHSKRANIYYLEMCRIYDEESEVWWFSVIDIMQVLTQQGRLSNC